MTLELPGGRRLLLAGGELGWAWLIVGAFAAGLLVWLYREERRLVSRRAGFTLLALRLAAAAVLIAALFEPIAARTYRETVRGRLLLAVDVSESMATRDPGRNGAERAGLIRELGLGPGDALDTLSRREVARRLLDGPNAPLARLAKDHDIEGYAFARDAAPATLDALVAALKTPSRPDDPAANVTDWLPTLGEALKTAQSSTRSAPVVGVVLVTDGRRNGGEDPGPTLDRLAARGIPVYPVLIGSTRPPRDAAVAAVKAPDSVYKGDVATIETVLKLDGYAGREVAVSLTQPGVAPLRQTVRAPADGSRPSLTFRVPLEQPGRVPLSIAIEPLDGDARPDNDRREVFVQVADDQARVLLVDGEARWEFQYLRNALARDPRVKLDAVVFRQPRPGLPADPEFVYGTGLPPRDPASAEAPGQGNAGAGGSVPDPLGTYDLIVLGDTLAADLDAEGWARLENYVSSRGGTLVFNPGPRGWEALTTNPGPRAVLPLLDPRPLPLTGLATNPEHPALPPGRRLLPTPEALGDPNAWPMLQLGAGPEESRLRWEGLAPLPWSIGGRAKPGATTLAAAEGDTAIVLMAAQPYGLGKVLWVGTDGTWRWRLRVGDAYHHRFWGQVVRWAAAGKLGAGNAFVRFGPTSPRIGEGEPWTIQARISDGVAGIGPATLLAARVLRPGKDPSEAAVVPLRPRPGQPRTFEGAAPGLAAGSYTIRLDAPGLEQALGLPTDPAAPPIEATVEVAPRDGPERVELAADRDPLDRLAAATGGRVFPEAEADALPPLLGARTHTAERSVETRLGEQPASLLLFFGLLTVEWLARKRAGLP